MPAATVLIPTHDHAETLPLAVASVQEQSLPDFELFIVGDGVGEASRRASHELAARDKRIRFFDFPKGPRKGERHRHTALEEAAGRFVAYLGDDDVWMPNHLETLDALLGTADFGHSLHLGVDEAGELFARPADLENPAFRDRLLHEMFNGFDLTFAGHTLAAYRRLPEGWRTTPPEFPWTDLYMWRQFLSQPWCRAKSVMVPTAICTQTHQRPHLTNGQMAAELTRWREAIARPGFREDLWQGLCQDFARQLVGHELDGTSLVGLTAAAGSILKRRLPWRIKAPLKEMRRRLTLRSY